MSKRTFQRTAKVLHRWCEDIHAKQLGDLVVIYFDGSWVLEIKPTNIDNPRANVLTDWKILGLRIRDLIAWLLKQDGFDGLEGLENDFEWRLYRGAH